MSVGPASLACRARLEDAREACVNACRRGLIPGFCLGPNQLGGSGQLRLDGRGVEGSCLPVAGISSGK